MSRLIPEGEGTSKHAFTLIELSIVLVIIGLIVGGVLTGRDLITAAETRAQISQIEKYNAAVRTFRIKYGGLPGDLLYTTASSFGFDTAFCTGAEASRDGNGFLYGYSNAQVTQRKENILFWQDLSTANLIDGTFPNGGATGVGCNNISTVNLSLTSGTSYLGNYLPVGKIGRGNFVYVYTAFGYNWYGLSALTSTDNNTIPYSNTTIPVIQAYNIDKKIDDGLATTGSVQAVYLNGDWTTNDTSTANAAGADSATSCYNTVNNNYSIGINGGNGANCALSFKFQ